MIEKLLRVSPHAMQIQRLTHSYGEQIAPVLNNPTPVEAISEEEVVYAEVDGSMLLTREKGWQEAKLGRVFNSSMQYISSKSRTAIKCCEYVAHLGNHQEFEQKMSVVTG